VGIGPETILRQVTRSRAATVGSFHEPKPNAVLSFSVVLRQVSFSLHSEKMTDELPMPPEDLLTDGTDFRPLSNLLI